MAEIKFDKSHPAGATNEERIRNRYGLPSSGYPGHEIREGARPLEHTAKIYPTAHMPLSEPYTSLLNAGLSRDHFAYNGEKRRR
jgi:hypothetical protein